MGHSCYRKQGRTIESESLVGVGNATMVFMPVGNTAIADCLLMHTTSGHKQSRIHAERATVETETRENLKEENGRARIVANGILGEARITRHAVDVRSEGSESVHRRLCRAEHAEKDFLGARRKEAETSSTFVRSVATRNERPRKKFSCRSSSCINANAAGR